MSQSIYPADDKRGKANLNLFLENVGDVMYFGDRSSGFRHETSRVELAKHRAHQIFLEEIKHYEADLANSVHSDAALTTFNCPRFKFKLMPHQEEGVRWMYEREENAEVKGGILADDMGLGKTIQTLSLIALRPSKMAGICSTIICVPAAVLDQWRSEYCKHLSETDFYMVTCKKDLRNGDRLASAEVVFISHDVLSQNIDLLKGVKFHRLVVDEAHNARSQNTILFNSLLKINAPNRWMLTGTPMINRRSDLYSLINLSGFFTFDVDLLPHIQTDSVKVALLITTIMQAYILRRTKTILNLPAVTIAKEYITLSPEEADCYSKIVEWYYSPQSVPATVWITRQRQCADIPNLARSQLLTELPALAAVPLKETVILKSTLGVDYFLSVMQKEKNIPEKLITCESDHVKYCGSTKIDKAVELVQRHPSEKILIYSEYVTVLAVVGLELLRNNIPVYLLTGSKNLNDRSKILNAFKSHEGRCVFLISKKTGSAGLNLIEASVVILFDPWWNWNVDSQCVGRAHRIGQQRDVQVYRLITRRSIEEHMLTVQDRKSDVERITLSEGVYIESVEPDNNYIQELEARLRSDEWS